MTGSIAITGADDFLGWHVRVLVRALGLPVPTVIDAADLADPDRLAGLLAGVDRVLHLADVDRGSVKEIFTGNVRLAEALTAGLRRCATPPGTVVFANSVRAGDGTPYGEGKSAAAAHLAEATRSDGSRLVDFRLPTLFGEHDERFPGSVVAALARSLAEGGKPTADRDRELDLLHATDAAGLLLDVEVPVATRTPVHPVRRTVHQLAYQLGGFAAVHRTGDLPDLTDRFDVRLFNTYRSYRSPANYPIRLVRQTDTLGELIEAGRVPGRGGQTWYSSTRPGATRGGYFHLAKIERIVVLRGDAELRLRRVLHDDVVTVGLSGREPAVVDVPTMWTHELTNTGDDELLTLCWANEILDPARPDTFPESIGVTGGARPAFR